MKKKILIAGGAGYVGSHCTKAIAEAGYEPVILDTLENGHRQFLKWGRFHNVDIRDRAAVRDVFEHERPDGVLLCAALIEVKDSQNQTIRYYDYNVAGAISLIEAAEATGVGAFVFSSTCAVYGIPERTPLDETLPMKPISPYGRTKYLVENILADMREFRNFPAMSLRYFNAAGSAWKDGIGERHQPETHAIPLAIQAALGRRDGFKIFGTDYDTPDGTAVRDYIHVLDLADAHVKAIDYLLAGNPGDVINLGTGHGNSVRQLVDAIAEISPTGFRVTEEPRRPGDPDILVADNSKAKRVLGWSPKHSFKDIVESAWHWHTEVEPRLFEDETARPLVQ
ncbi:MAG: UDP-glucose 4-epimerase GalE [Henriciella sp.]